MNSSRLSSAVLSPTTVPSCGHWQNIQIRQETKHYAIRQTVDRQYPITSHEINYKFTQEFAKKLFDDEMVCVSRDTNMDGSITYLAELSISPPDLKYSQGTEEVYVIDGIKFNKRKIEHALRDTYPEYFL